MDSCERPHLILRWLGYADTELEPSIWPGFLSDRVVIRAGWLPKAALHSDHDSWSGCPCRYVRFRLRPATSRLTDAGDWGTESCKN